MIAVDTNVVVRLLTADHPGQTTLASELARSEKLFLSATVLLEVVWVLRASYGQNRVELCDILGKLLGFPGLVIEDREQVVEAYELARHGMELADAIHLARCPANVAFATFDGDLSKAAVRAKTKRTVRFLRVEAE